MVEREDRRYRWRRRGKGNGKVEKEKLREREREFYKIDTNMHISTNSFMFILSPKIELSPIVAVKRKIRHKIKVKRQECKK